MIDSKTKPYRASRDDTKRMPTTLIARNSSADFTKYDREQLEYN